MSKECEYCGEEADGLDPFAADGLGDLHASTWGDMHLLCLASHLQNLAHTVTGELDENGMMKIGPYKASADPNDSERIWELCVIEAVRVVVSNERIKDASERERAGE